MTQQEIDDILNEVSEDVYDTSDGFVDLPESYDSKRTNKNSSIKGKTGPPGTVYQVSHGDYAAFCKKCKVSSFGHKLRCCQCGSLIDTKKNYGRF